MERSGKDASYMGLSMCRNTHGPIRQEGLSD